IRPSSSCGAQRMPRRHAQLPMPSAAVVLDVNRERADDQYAMVFDQTHDGQPNGRPAEEPTDAELIARSIDDPRAFMPLVQRHQRVLYGYLARRIGRDQAEDVASETFTR